MTTTTRAPRRKDGPALIKSGRVNKTRLGEVYDRSVPLTRDDARKMAVSLATLAGFVDVRALSTKHASADGKTWFVRWHRDATPNPVATMQELRVERALHQAPEMEAFLADEDATIPRRWILHRYPEMEGQFGLYLTSLDACTCPDHQYRGPKVGACKHMQYLVGYLRATRPRMTAEEKALDAKAYGW